MEKSDGALFSRTMAARYRENAVITNLVKKKLKWLKQVGRVCKGGPHAEFKEIGI